MVTCTVCLPTWFKYRQIRKEEPRNQYGLAITTFGLGWQCQWGTRCLWWKLGGREEITKESWLFPLTLAYYRVNPDSNVWSKKDVKMDPTQKQLLIVLLRNLNSSALPSSLRDKLGLYWTNGHNTLSKIIQLEEVRLDV